MIEERIRTIEARLRDSAHLSEATRQELLELLEALRREIASLPESQKEEGQSIARFAEVSTHEATRPESRPRLLQAALEGLTGSVEEFEASHPELTSTINRMALILSNMGM